MAFIGALFLFILVGGLVKDLFWGVGHTMRLFYKFADFATTPEGFGKLLTYALLIVAGLILWALFVAVIL